MVTTMVIIIGDRGHQRRRSQPTPHARGPELSAEMMIACLDARLRVIEIPVNYFNRSASQIRAYRNPQTFWSFLRLILRRRWQA